MLVFLYLYPNICYAVVVDRIDRKVRPVIIISAVNNTRFTRANVPVTVKVMLRYMSRFPPPDACKTFKKFAYRHVYCIRMKVEFQKVGVIFRP